MDERDIVERAQAWQLNSHPEQSLLIIHELASEVASLRHDLTRARETQGELLACYEQASSNVEAELAAAREEVESANEVADDLLAELIALRARVVEVGKMLASITEIAGTVVSDEAVIDVTYCHNYGKKYGIVQTRMKWFRALSNLVKEVESAT